jgi:RHS repeat-associated protein
VVVTTGGATWTSTGAYDAASSLAIQKLPGGITQTQDFDNAGEKTGLRYTGQVTTLNDDGSTSVNPNGGWMSWSATNDVTGRTAREWTPDGAAFAGSIGDAQPYDRAYSYDTASRLTQVRDRTAPTGADITTDPEAMPCQTRTYQYDGNGNRLTKLTSDVANGPCATSGGTAQNRTFDTADRPSAYTYDALGRTSSITAADAPNPAGGQISFSYYDNDAVRSTTQGSATTSYELDAADRRSAETTTAAGVPAIQTTRYYNDESDNPAWIVKDGKVQTYAELIGSDLTLTTDGGDAELAISNPHGDIVTTIALTPGALADGITGWNNFDEFGNPGTSNNASTGALAYGWLGASQRATTPSGLLLMGSRVYNPTSGTFGSVDPVRGGNVNAYTYPVDPVNYYDISGNRKTEERGTKLATKKQVKKVKAKVKKARSKYKRVMREYRSMLKRGKHIGPRCILRIIVMIAVWVGIVAGMALIPLTGPLVPWLWVAAVSAWIAWIAPIMDMADACTAPTGGRD